MFFTKEQLGERQTRLQVAVQYLQKAIESDNTSGASWYLLGRYVIRLLYYCICRVSFGQCLAKRSVVENGLIAG